MTTIIRQRCPSLVQYFPSPQQPRNMKYRLVYDNNAQSYNGGVPFDVESSSFNVQGTPVIRSLATTLSGVSAAIGKVYCCIKGNNLPRGSTTGFCFVDHHYILTTSDLLQNEHGVAIDPSTLVFWFTSRIVTKDFVVVSPSLMPVSFVHSTRSLLLLRLTDPLPVTITPLLPNKAFMMNNAFDSHNTNPEYVQKTSIGIIGYCGRITLDTAMSDYNSLPDGIRANIRAPTVDDILEFPTEHKAFFPGRLLAPLEGVDHFYTVSASVHHGCCGAPVFCPADPTKFIGVVYGGDHIANDNTIISILSPEFDALFLRL